MTLGQKQEIFSRFWGLLLTWAHLRHYRIRHGEIFRPPEMCRIYYERGQGILNSLHGKKLAGDLFVTLEDGSGMWDWETYEPLGTYWKSLHPLCRWGGDFARRDAYHFSIEHRGVK